MTRPDRGRPLAILFVLLVLVAVACLSAAGAPAPAQTAASTPVADTYVDATHPRTNYGTARELKVDAHPMVRSFLRFNVRAVSGAVTKATLQLYALKSSKAGFEVHDAAKDSWPESLTLANAPKASSTVIARSGPYGANRYVTVDVTRLVKSNGLASFAVTGRSSNELRFSSSEKAATEAPRLVVAFEPSTTAPVNTSLPTVSGQPRIGETLTATHGTWRGAQPITYLDQWRRCNSAGALCADISGATTTTYTVTTADADSTLRFRTTAKNGKGSREAISAATAAVPKPPAASPVIAAAGDIACDSGTATATTCHQKETSDLLVNQGLAAVLPLGDIQYENGELGNFNAYYDATWGRVKNIT
jgi:hypothetical protein